MLPALATLVTLQKLDTAAEARRRRLAELPLAEQAIDRAIAAAAAHVEKATGALNANQQSRRELEKQVATIDTRLARFDDHKAAVKTNQEYTALLHEISTAKAEKDALEEQILLLMEAADGMSADVSAAHAELATARLTGDADRARLAEERRRLEAELGGLAAEKATTARDLDPVTLARYEKLLEQRKMVAVAAIQGELCTACHVRLRPAVVQLVRRNAEILSCDSCQRILYAVAPESPAAPPPA
jgi:predicted  nucleic acid-binding Zn-ribbon protein